MGHCLVNGDVRARFLPQPERGKIGQLNLTRVDDDEFGAVLADGLLEKEADDRVRFGRVAASYDERIQLFHFADAIAHRAAADGQLQGRDAAGVAEARAMVDVVGLQHSAHEFLEDVIVFVGRFGAGIGGDTIATVFAHQAAEAAGDEILRLIPAGFAEGALAVIAQERFFQAARVGGEIQPEAAFHAKVTVVRRAIEGGLDAIDGVVADLQVHLATDTAIGTGGANLLAGGDRLVRGDGDRYRHGRTPA